MEREIVLSSYSVRSIPGNRLEDFITKLLPQGRLCHKGPLASGFSWETAKAQTAKYHVTMVLPSRLRFAVHVLTAKKASSGK